MFFKAACPRVLPTTRHFTLFTILLVSIAGVRVAAASDTDLLKVAKLAHHEQMHVHRDTSVELQMLSDAAAGIGRRIEWIELDTPYELRQSLLNRRADVYISPLPLVTDDKLADAEIASLTPIGFERYRLVAKAEQNYKTTRDLAGLKVAVKFSSPALPYLRELKESLPGFAVVVIPDRMSRNKLLAKVAEGVFDAAVIATDFRSDYLNQFSSLAYQFDLSSLHPVSWKVHADNTDLIAQINKFLQRYHASYIEESVQKSIGDDGVVRVIVELEKNYVLNNGEPIGFEYELIKRFAKQNNLRLDILVAKDKHQASRWLKSGIGDIAMSQVVADYPDLASEFTLSREYRHDIPVLLSHHHQEIGTLSALQGKRIAAIEKTPHVDALRALDSNIEILVLDESTHPDAALAALKTRDFDGLVVSSHQIPKLLRTHAELRAGLSLPIKQRFRWAIRKGNAQLTSAVDEFFRQQYQTTEFNLIAKRYTRKRFEKSLDRISPYDKLIKTYAEKYDFDWRLIAAQIYQESRFDPAAVSSAGARGLMQIMPATASDLGLANPELPEASIHAGIKYLDHLRGRFEDEVPQSERLWMALAAYNTGFERVKRARKLAIEMGLNPNRWFDNVEVAMRKMTQPDSPVRGCRCGQAIVYVRSIRSLYSAYRYVGAA